MNLIEAANGQKQTSLILAAIVLFVAISLLGPCFSIWALCTTSNFVAIDIIAYLFLSAFSFCSACFLVWKLYDDLKTEFTDQGLERNGFGSVKRIQWNEIDRIVVHVRSGHHFRLDVSVKERQELRIVLLFYRRPEAVLNLLTAKANDRVVWEIKRV